MHAVIWRMANVRWQRYAPTYFFLYIMLYYSTRASYLHLTIGRVTLFWPEVTIVSFLYLLVFIFKIFVNLKYKFIKNIQRKFSKYLNRNLQNKEMHEMESLYFPFHAFHAFHFTFTFYFPFSFLDILFFFFYVYAYR